MDQRIQKWERTRKRGMWRFLLLWTVMLGGAMIGVTALFDYFVSSGRPVLENMKIRAPILLACAFVSGAVLWFVSERRFKKVSKHWSSGGSGEQPFPNGGEDEI